MPDFKVLFGATPPAYPHFMVLWENVDFNPIKKLRELRKLIHTLWVRHEAGGEPPRVSDIPKDLQPYLTQTISFKTLTSVYGEGYVKQIQDGEIEPPQDMAIPDAIIVGTVRGHSFNKEEFEDNLILGKRYQPSRTLIRPSRWQEGQSVEVAEQAYMEAVNSLKGEFRALSDNQAHAAGRDTSLITYVYRRLTAEPFHSGRPGFQVVMEFRQVTRLGKITAKDLTDNYQVLSDVGEYPVDPPNRMNLMTMMKPADQIKLHNPFRDEQGNRIPLDRIGK